MARRRRRGSLEGCGLLAGFLVLAMVAVALGYLYGNYLFQGLFSREGVPPRTLPAGTSPADEPDQGAPDPGEPGDDEPADEPPDEPDEPGEDPVTGPQTILVVVDELELVRVQLGAFSEVERAEELAESVRLLGRPAYVTRPMNGLRRVWVLLADDRDAAWAYKEPLDNLVEDIAVFSLRPLGESTMTLRLSGDDPAQLESAETAIKALLSFIQGQGAFWSGFVVGRPPSPPAFDAPDIRGQEGHWSGQLADLVDMARAQAHGLADAAGRGFPQGMDREMVPAYLELADLTIILLSSLR